MGAGDAASRSTSPRGKGERSGRRVRVGYGKEVWWGRGQKSAGKKGEKERRPQRGQDGEVERSEETWAEGLGLGWEGQGRESGGKVRIG